MIPSVTWKSFAAWTRFYFNHCFLLLLILISSVFNLHPESAIKSRQRKMASAHSTAASRVLHTSELLEHILLCCDEHTVLHTSGTNHFFNNVINGSLKLQQKLYLKADWTAATDDDTGILNPLLYRKQSQPVRHNMDLISFHQSTLYMHSLTVPDAGSCVDMFLSQPPTTEVKARARPPTADLRDWEFIMVSNPNGVTWGDVCQAWEERVRDHQAYARLVRGASMARARRAEG